MPRTSWEGPVSLGSRRLEDSLGADREYWPERLSQALVGAHQGQAVRIRFNPACPLPVELGCNGQRHVPGSLKGFAEDQISEDMYGSTSDHARALIDDPKRYLNRIAQRP